MIDLTVPCALADRNAPPFVAQLFTGNASIHAHPEAAHLAAEDGECRIFQRADGTTMTFPKPAAERLIDGEVLFIDPARSHGQRWIRPGSRHNTLLVTEQCDQLCQMCSQPPKKSHVDLFGHFAAACRLAPKDATIGLSGGEPTLHKEALFELLKRLHGDRPDLSFHVLSNAQHFASADRSNLQRLDKVLWGVPLYADTPALHDKIVGKAGAFERLLSGLSVLGLSGAAIELRTVVMRPNADNLPRLADMIAAKLSFVDVWAMMQLEHIGFAKGNWNKLFFDHSSNFAAIARALACVELHGIDVALYNFPLCTVPVAWRRLAVPSISDWKRKFISTCDPCSAQARCSGFFEWHPADHGFRQLRAI